MFIFAFARFCALEEEDKMLKYGVIYLGCWSIIAHVSSQPTEIVKNNLEKSKIESGSTTSLDVVNGSSYRPMLQFLSIPFFTTRLVRGENVQLPEPLEDIRDLSRRVQKLEAQDGRKESTSNETVVDAARCNGKPNQSGNVSSKLYGIVEEDSSGSIAIQMTKLLQSIESSMHKFRTSLDVVQKNMKLVNQSLNEIANHPTMPGTEPNTALHYSHRHVDVSMDTNDTLPTDCWDVFKSGYNVSGVYKIKPVPRNATTFYVYCQMDVHGGGWTVLQNRYDGQVNFNHDWEHYKSGFGNLNTEFWLGLDHIHELTNSKVYEILIELKDFDLQTGFATYDRFLIGSEAEKYRILLLGAYKGNAGDSFSYHAGQNFTTWDMDNDKSESNCAITYPGGWWFDSCFHSHLNGLYFEEKTANPRTENGGINWGEWRSVTYSLKETRMSIRPRGVAVFT